MRLVLGVIAGFVVAILCVLAIEALGHSLYPPPAGIDATDPADQKRLMAVMPDAAKAFVIAGWFLGALLGGLVANKVARRALAGWIVAALIVAGGAYSMVAFPHPMWMIVGGVLLPLVAAWLAQRLAKVPF